MTGILIIARLGSTRLSQKHLISVNGQTFIEWLVKRFEHEFLPEIENSELKIVIASSVQQDNLRFGELFQNKSTEVFYGSDENIPLRQLQCAEAFHFENVISIDGDDVLCSTAAARKIFEALREGYSIAKTTKLPLGMNVAGYRRAYLQKALNENRMKEKLETGWGRIFNDADILNLEFSGFDEASHLRMTLDYQQDSDFFYSIISKLGSKVISIDDVDLIEFINREKLYEINQELNDQYWVNFNKEKKAEES